MSTKPTALTKKELLSRIEAAKESLHLFKATDLRFEPAWKVIRDGIGMTTYNQWRRASAYGRHKMKLSGDVLKHIDDLERIRPEYEEAIQDLEERMPPLVNEAARGGFDCDAMLLMSKRENMSTDAAVRAERQLDYLAVTATHNVDPSDGDGKKESPPVGGADKLSGEERALAVLVKNSGLTMGAIADKAGVARTSLYRMTKFMHAKNVMEGHAKTDFQRRQDAKQNKAVDDD